MVKLTAELVYKKSARVVRSDMSAYMSDRIRSYVGESVTSEPPYELVHNGIGKLLWQPLNREEIDAYSHIMIYFREAHAQASFVQYHYRGASGKIHRFTIQHGKVFILDTDNNYHQIRQMHPNEVESEIDDLPQIVTLNYFPH